MRKRNNGKKTILLLVIVLLISSFVVVFSQYTNPKSLSKDTASDQRATDNNSCLGEESVNLPIVVIDTKGQNIEEVNVTSSAYKTPRYEAEFQLYNSDSQGNIVMCEGEKPIISEKIIIGVRGKSSMSKPKKQFSVKVIDDMGKEKEVPLLNMPPDKEWVLNGLSADSSLIRNHLAYQISGEIMEYAPDTRFCEVHILDQKNQKVGDTSYRGVYMLMEKITRNPNRVDLRKTDDRLADTSFIIARDKIKVGQPVLDSLWGSVLSDQILNSDGTVKKRSTLTYVYPGKSRITEEQKNYIENYINDFELSLYSRNFKDKKVGYRNFIDVMSFVDYAIINEFFKNVDGGDVSTYFYRDVGGLLYAGPVWDFDLTLGLPKGSPYSTVEGFRMYNTPWFDQLFKDPYFVDMYVTRYTFLRKNVLSEEHLFQVIDDAVEELGEAIHRNNAKWSKNVDVDILYEIEIREMKDYIKQRADWIDQNTAILYRMDESDL
ncbi:CotH kinase family protein [Bacillus sp. JJ722]|uniref:CotH kinase family protein n=1 Tax=Bacillus sp. JJ722 TaxID=3122973 RepID=UPI003000811E